MPKISVVIPARNRADTIGSCLDSILAQTRPVDEIIVCDDGSTDDTAQVVEGYIAREGQIKIKLVRHTRPMGAQAARNSAIRASSGDLIAFNDSDDQWIEQKIEVQLIMLDNSHAGVIHSGSVMLEESTGQYSLFACELSEMQGRCLKAVLEKPGPMFQGLMTTRGILESIGLLDEKVPSYQEWDTAIRLAKVANFAYTSLPLFIYHTGARDAISASATREARGYEYIVNKHKREIMKQTPELLASHYNKLVEKFSTLGQPDAAARYQELSEEIRRGDGNRKHLYCRI